MLKFNSKVVQKRPRELVLGLRIEPEGKIQGGGAASPCPIRLLLEVEFGGAFVHSEGILVEGCLGMNQFIALTGAHGHPLFLILYCKVSIDDLEQLKYFCYK